MHQSMLPVNRVKPWVGEAGYIGYVGIRPTTLGQQMLDLCDSARTCCLSRTINEGGGGTVEPLGHISRAAVAAWLRYPLFSFFIDHAWRQGCSLVRAAVTKWVAIPSSFFLFSIPGTHPGININRQSIICVVLILNCTYYRSLAFWCGVWLGCLVACPEALPAVLLLVVTQVQAPAAAQPSRRLIKMLSSPPPALSPCRTQFV